MGNAITDLSKADQTILSHKIFSLSLYQINYYFQKYKSYCEDFWIDQEMFLSIFNEFEDAFHFWDYNFNSLVNGLDIFCSLIVFSQSSFEEQIDQQLMIFDLNDLLIFSNNDIEFMLYTIFNSISNLLEIEIPNLQDQIYKFVLSIFRDDINFNCSQIYSLLINNDKIHLFYFTLHQQLVFTDLKKNNNEEIEKPPINEIILRENNIDDKLSNYRKMNNYKNIMETMIINKNQDTSVSIQTSWIYGFNCSTSKQIFASCSSNFNEIKKNKYILIYSVGKIIVLLSESFKYQKYFTEHTSEITTFCLSENKKLCASCETSDISLILIWDIESLKVLKKIKTKIQSIILNLFFFDNDSHLLYSSTSKRSTIDIYSFKSEKNIISFSCKDRIQEVILKISKVHLPVLKKEKFDCFIVNFDNNLKLFKIDYSDNSYSLECIFHNMKYPKILNVLFLEYKPINEIQNKFYVFIGSENLFFIIIESSDLKIWKNKLCLSLKFSISKISMYFNKILILLSNSVIQIFDFNELSVIYEQNIQQMDVIFKSTSVHQLYMASLNTYYLIIENGDVIKMNIKSVKKSNHKKHYKTMLRLINEIVYLESEIKDINYYVEGLGNQKLIVSYKSKPSIQTIDHNDNVLSDKMPVREIVMCMDSYFDEINEYNLLCTGMFGGEIIFYLNSIQVQVQKGFKEFSQTQIIKFIKKSKWVVCTSNTKYLIVLKKNKEKFNKIENYIDLTTNEDIYETQWYLNVPKDEVVISINVCLNDSKCVLQTLTNKFFNFDVTTGTFNLLFDISVINTQYNIFRVCSKSESFRNNDFIQNQFVLQNKNNGIIIISGEQGELLVFSDFNNLTFNNYLMYKIHLSSIDKIVYEQNLSKIYTVAKNDKFIVESQLIKKNLKISFSNSNDLVNNYLEKQRSFVKYKEIRHLYIEDSILYLLNYHHLDLVSMLISNGKKMNNVINPVVPNNGMNLIKVLNVTATLYNTNFKYLKTKISETKEKINKPVVNMDFQLNSILVTEKIKKSNVKTSTHFKRKTFKTENLQSKNLISNSRFQNIGKSDIEDSKSLISTTTKDGKYSFFKSAMKNIEFDRYLIYAMERVIVISPAEDLSVQYIFQFHQNEITCLEVSSQGSFIASIDRTSNPKIILWNPQSFQVLKEIQTYHDESVLFLKLSNDESKILTISSGTEWFIQISSSTNESTDLFKKGINDKVVSIKFDNFYRFFILTYNYLVKYEIQNIELVSSMYPLHKSELKNSCPVDFFFLEKEQINAIVFFANGDVRYVNTNTNTLNPINNIGYSVLSIVSFNYECDIFYSLINNQNDLIIYNSKFKLLCSICISDIDIDESCNYILSQDIITEIKTNKIYIMIQHYDGSVMEIELKYNKNDEDLISIFNKKEVTGLNSVNESLKCIDIHPSLMLMMLCTGGQFLIFYEPVDFLMISKIYIGYNIQKCYFSFNEKVIVLLTDENYFLFLSTASIKSNGMKISDIDQKIIDSMIIENDRFERIVFEVSFSFNNDFMAVSYISLKNSENKKIGSIAMYTFVEEMENNILKRKFKLSFEFKPSSKSFNKSDLLSNYIICSKCLFTEDSSLLIANYAKMNLNSQGKFETVEKSGTLIYFDVFKKIEKTMNPINKDLKLNPLYFSEALKVNNSYGPLSYSPTFVHVNNKISEIIQNNELNFAVSINYLGYSILGESQGNLFISNQISLNENSFQDDKPIQIKRMLGHSGKIIQIKSLRNTGVILTIKENGQGVMQWKVNANDSSNSLDGNDILQKNNKTIINNIDPWDILLLVKKDFSRRKQIITLDNLGVPVNKSQLGLKMVMIHGFSSSNFSNNLFINLKSQLIFISSFNIVKIKNSIKLKSHNSLENKAIISSQIMDNVLNLKSFVNNAIPKNDVESIFSYYNIDYNEKNDFSISVIIINHDYSKLIVALKNNPAKICIYKLSYKKLIGEISLENIEIIYQMSISLDDKRLTCLCLNSQNQPEVYFICLIKNRILSYTSLKYNSVKKFNSIDFFYGLNDKFIVVGANNCSIWNYKTNCLDFNEISLKTPETKKGIADMMESEQRIDLNNLFFTVVKSFSSTGFIIADFRGYVCLVNKNKVTNIKKTFGELISVIEFLKEDRSVFATAGKSNDIYIFKICSKFPENYHLENTLIINLKTILIHQGMDYSAVNESEFIIQSLRPVKQNNIFVGIKSGIIYNVEIQQIKNINTECDCQINTGPITSDKVILANNKQAFDFKIRKIFETFDNEIPKVIFYLNKYQMYVIGCKSGFIFAFDYKTFVVVFTIKLEEEIKSMTWFENSLIINTYSYIYSIEDKLIQHNYNDYLKSIKEKEYFDYICLKMLSNKLITLKSKVLKLIVSKSQNYVVMIVEINSKTFIEIYSSKSFSDILANSNNLEISYLKSIETSSLLFIDFSDNENHFCMMNKDGTRMNFMINKDNLSEISIQQNSNIQWQHNGSLTSKNIQYLLRVFNDQNYINTINKVDQHIYLVTDNMGCVILLD